MKLCRNSTRRQSHARLSLILAVYHHLRINVLLPFHLALASGGDGARRC